MQTFFDFTPPKHLTAGVASVCGPRVKRSALDFRSTALLIRDGKAELSCKKYGRGVCSVRKKIENTPS